MISRFLFAVAILACLPVVALAQEGDPEKGEKVFRKCRACHVADKPTNRVGPHLFGVLGRPAASVEGYNYSEAMKTKAAEGLVWDEEKLDAYLADPKSFIPGNKMVFPGLKKEDEREDVIAYLRSQGH